MGEAKRRESLNLPYQGDEWRKNKKIPKYKKLKAERIARRELLKMLKNKHTEEVTE